MTYFSPGVASCLVHTRRDQAEAVRSESLKVDTYSRYKLISSPATLRIITSSLWLFEPEQIETEGCPIPLIGAKLPMYSDFYRRGKKSVPGAVVHQIGGMGCKHPLADKCEKPRVSVVNWVHNLNSGLLI